MQIPYQLQRVEIFKGAGRAAEYLHVNPNGTIPTLDDNGFIIYESGAICMYLTDKYSEHQLAPEMDSQDRALYYQWMFFVSSTLEQPLWQIFYHTHFLPEAKRLPQVVRYSKRFFIRAAKTLEKTLTNQAFILGEKFSTADIMLASTLQWFPEYNEDFPAIQDYCKRLIQRPAYQRMLAK